MRPSEEEAREIYEKYKQFNHDKDFNSRMVVEDDYITKMLSLAYINGRIDQAEYNDDDIQYNYWMNVWTELIKLKV